MNCTTKEDFNSAIEHHYAINNTHHTQTAEDTVNFLNRTSENVQKIDGKYSSIRGKAQISKSVTEKAGSKFKYYSENPLLEKQGKLGNDVHDILYGITKMFLDYIGNSSVETAYNKLSSFKPSISNPGFSQVAIEKMIEGVRSTLGDIYRQQRTINRLTNSNGNVTILPEQVLIDPRRDIGGTSDLIAIFSDNTAAIADYKTKIIKASNLDAFGNIIDKDQVVYKKDVDKYKLQTQEYGKILINSYGVKSIRSVVILPLKIVVPFDNLKKEYGKIKDVSFPGQDPNLEKVIPFANKTGFKRLDEFFQKYDKQIEKLEKSITSSNKEEVQAKVDELKSARKEFLLNHNLGKIVDYTVSLIEKVQNAQLGKLSISELQDLLNELKLLQNVTESTHEYREYLSRYNSTKDKSDNMIERINSLSTLLSDSIQDVEDVLFNEKVAKLVEATTGFRITDDMGNIIPFTQEGPFGKWFYQLSQYNNPIFQTLRKILDQVNYQVRQRTDEVVSEIVETENKVYNWLKSSGRSFEDFVKIMIDPSTDNFWKKYSKEFLQKLESLPSSEIHKYFEPSENYEEWYSETLERKRLQFEKENLSKEEISNKINYWISHNSLEVKGGIAKYPNAWMKFKQTNRLHLKENTTNYSSEYKFILSVPELKSYYEMFEKYNKIFREKLGVEYNKLPNNFLPNIRKSMSERITEDGFQGFLSGTQDFFKDFSIREEDRSNDTTYNSNEQIPIFFLNRFKNSNGDLQVGEKSYQFGRSLAIFAKMVFNHEAITETHAEILALQQFLDTSAEQILERRGKVVIDSMGNPITEKLQSTDLPDIFRSFVDMYVYNIGIKPIIGDKDGSAEKMLMKAKEYFTLKSLGFNFIAAAGSLASAKINTIVESNKGIIFNKTNYQDSMKSSWSEREKFLAINAFFDPMSHRLNNPRFAEEKKYGERFYSDPTMRGWINKYVNSRMLMNSFSVGDQYIEELILVAMSKNYYVDGLGNLRRVKNQADYDINKDRLIWNLFSYSKESGAKLNLSQEQLANAFESFRRAVQAGQSRIKGTIPEEDKAYWQSNIIAQLLMHFKSWMPGIFFERFGKVKFDNRIDSIYMGKYVALGKEFTNPDKLVFSEFFKKILLPKLGNLVSDITTFGLLSSRRLNDAKSKELYFEKWLDNNPQYKGRVSFEDFNEVQQKQLKSVIQELRVLLVFAALISLLGADWDDDGEKDYKKYLLTRKLASLLFKTQQELSFVYSPVAFTGMVKNPIPIVGLFTDAYVTATNTVDEILDIPFGEDRLIGGQTNDKQPILYNTHKWVPGLGGIMRFLDVFNNDVTYSK